MPFFDYPISHESFQTTLLLSLLAIWSLAGLFAGLNHHIKRQLFTPWTAAWLFYVLWLTITFLLLKSPDHFFLQLLREWCLSASAVFLFWGSFRFLGLRFRQMLMGLFLLFLFVWSYWNVYQINYPLPSQLPLFAVVSLASFTSAWAFFQYRRRLGFSGATIVSIGFSAWALYIVSCLFIPEKNFGNISIFISEMFQLIIAFGMIVVVLQESGDVRQQIFHRIRTEKSATRH
jgi:hypothetical protein